MNSTTLLLLPILMFGLLLASCNQQKETNSNNNQSTYDNPFEYCKAVENIDTLGSDSSQHLLQHGKC